MFKVVLREASDAPPADSDDRCGLLRNPQPPGTRQIVATAALLAGLAATALWIDLPIAQFVRDHGLPGDLRRLVRLAEVFGWGGTVAIVILTAATLDPRGWRVGLRLAAAAFGAGVTADGLKLLIARLRPSAAVVDGLVWDTFISWLPLLHRDELGQPYGYSLQSFPSAHAATAAGLAVALAALYPRGRWLFAAFALMACLQRVEAQAHFASDVLAGAAVGCIVAAASLRSIDTVVARQTAK